MPRRNAWFRHHQQSRIGAFRLVHFQLLGALILAIGVIALMARMQAYQQAKGRTSKDSTWSHIHGEQLLSLLGMGTELPVLSREGSLITMHQRTNVSVKMAAYEKGAEQAVSPPPSASLNPNQAQSRGRKKKEAAKSDMELLAEELQKVLHDPPGLVPRLNTSIEEPLGSGNREDSPLCGAFSGPATKTVAIVGNGPLDQAQRSAIDECDVVVRFNLMNNWRRFNEKVHVWVIRYSTEASLGYWGITNIAAPEATKVVGLLKAMWLVGGRQKSADSLVKKLPAVAEANPVLIPQEPLAAAYSRRMNVSEGYPSTGFVGVLGTLHCTPEDVVLHLFGFNWHNSTWKGHKMDSEKAYVERLVQKGRVVIHETTCYGVRECGGKSTFDASCHWNAAGRYVCLRGKPRKWTDLTDTLGSGRLEQFKGQAPDQAPPAAGATALLR